MRRVPLLLLLVLPLVAAGCFGSGGVPADVADDPGPAASGPAMADPLSDGPFTISVREYDAGHVNVGGAGPDHADYEYDAPVRGVLFEPVGDGPFPVVVFEHGRHSTCGFEGREAYLSPPGGCEDNDPWYSYPSYRGYDYLGRHLASHGYVVASIDVNTVNARDASYPYGREIR